MWHESQKGFPSLSTNNSKAMEQTGYVTGSICIEPSPSQLVFQCQLAHGVQLDWSQTLQILLSSIRKSLLVSMMSPKTKFCSAHAIHIEWTWMRFSSTLWLFLISYSLIWLVKEGSGVGQTKSMLGVTVADNGAGRVDIQVGDHIEKINGESMIGKRHYQVAQALRSIQTNEQFTLRLVSPLKNGFSMVSPRQCGSQNGKKTVSDANATIRFDKHGKPVVEEIHNEVVTKQLNDVFAKYLGFQDERLTADILEISDSCNTLLDMEQAVQSTPLAEFRFPTEFLFDLWGIINDAKRQKTL
uniref:PDZ domain-containing protein n=1 Tax=Ditylenchus dipsaci TaxID=166011 RepID=A0A915ENU6_9BILA